MVSECEKFKEMKCYFAIEFFFEKSIGIGIKIRYSKCHFRLIGIQIRIRRAEVLELELELEKIENRISNLNLNSDYFRSPALLTR